MAGTIQCGRRSRKDFGKIPSIVEIPNLIEVQKRSYETFLQKDVAADRREEIGLQAVFKSVFPIADYNRSEEHTSELQSPYDLVCRLLLEKKKTHHERQKQPYVRQHTYHPSRTQLSAYETTESLLRAGCGYPSAHGSQALGIETESNCHTP